MSAKVKAQNNVGINAGIGLPEGIHVGIQYPWVKNQLQFGTYIGSVPSDDAEDSYLSISGDLYYHFAGTSTHSPLKPWFSRFNLNYLKTETGSDLNKYFLSNLRVGRQLHISDHFAIELDFGVYLRLYKDEIEKETSGNWFNLDFDLPVVFPSGGIKLAYRF